MMQNHVSVADIEVSWNQLTRLQGQAISLNARVKRSDGRR